MVTVRFLLGEPPYEPGDVAELTEADAENKLLDGIVEYIDAVKVEYAPGAVALPTEYSDEGDPLPEIEADEEAEGAE